MHECSKAVRRRLGDPAFLNRYLRGDGLDLPGEDDALHQYADFFPLIRALRTIDARYNDVQALPGLTEGSFDFVHSGHCLVRLSDPQAALCRWFELLRDGGHLVFTVPDEDLYEQGVFPSTFNPSHQHTMTIHKERSWSPASLNVLDLLRGLGPRAAIIKVELCHQTFRPEQTRRDQTLDPFSECVIEVVVRKCSTPEITDGGRRPAPAPIYGGNFAEFGDSWALVSELVEESRATGAERLLSRYSLGNQDLGPLLREILGVLDLRGAQVTLCDRPRNTDRFFSVCTNRGPYARTRPRWSRRRARAQGCYQLESKRFIDGAYRGRKHSPNDPHRLLPDEELAAVLRLFAEQEFPMIELGQHLGIAGSIEVASQSRFFIGIDSGMSHLCHSVGLPMYLYEGRGAPFDLGLYHPAKTYDTFRTVADVAAILERYR